MAVSPSNYTMVRFKELPIEKMNAQQCVPTSWIKTRFDSVQVAVAFPSEMTSTNKSMKKTGKPPLNKWNVYPAVIERATDIYEETYTPAAVKASPAPQTPLNEHMENLNLGGPSTPKGKGKPKNLQKDMNTPEASGGSNTINVDENLLKELYETWNHMNSLMEKIFKKDR